MNGVSRHAPALDTPHGLRPSLLRSSSAQRKAASQGQDSVLPPLRDHRKLALELRLVVWTDRDDALQEAWLAHLEGRNAARAVNTFARRERRHRQRMVPILN